MPHLAAPTDYAATEPFEMPSSPRYRAPALEKGLEILEFLARQTVPMNLSEISDGLGRSKSEIFRMLQVLEERRYLARTAGDEGYVLTNRLFLLGLEKPPVKGLLEVALPIMHRLADDILQPCHLAVPSEEFIAVIARVDSPGDIGFVVRIGHRRPLPHSTSGLVLIAFQAEPERTRWLDLLDSRQVRYDRKRLVEKIKTIAAQGYASIPSELVPSVTDLSAPILQHKVAIAALTVPYLERRTPKVGHKECIGLLSRAAQQISEELSYGDNSTLER